MKRFLISLLLIVATGSSARGWNEFGHRLIGSIAYRQLNAEQRAVLLEILRKHPRFEADFQSKMPKEVKSDAEKNEWLFQQAAYWPDLVAGSDEDVRKEYHHPAWHVIRHTHYLWPEER